MEPEFINFIKSDKTFLEKEPLEKVTKMNELLAYKHQGFGNAWILNEIKTN